MLLGFFLLLFSMMKHRNDKGLRHFFFISFVSLCASLPFGKLVCVTLCNNHLQSGYTTKIHKPVSRKVEKAQRFTKKKIEILKGLTMIKTMAFEKQQLLTDTD